MKRWGGLALRLGVTALAFAWIFRLVDLRQLADALRRTNPEELGVACLIYLVAFLACVWRWHLLLTATHRVPWPQTLRWTFLGAFFNTLLPTTIGGDVVRIHEAGRAIGDWHRATASVLLDRLSGFLALFAIGVIAAVTALPRLSDPLIARGFVGLVLIFALVVVGLASRRVFGWLTAPLLWIRLGRWHTTLQEFQTMLHAYRQHGRAVRGALGLSLIVQAAAVGLCWLVARAMALPIPAWAVAAFVPILMSIAMLPISLNGLGIREGAAILLLNTVGIGEAEALGWSLLCAAIPALSGMLGAIVFVGYRRQRRSPASD